MRVGTGKSDITPELGLRLAGMLGAGRAESIHSPLRARAVVVEQASQKIAVIALDLLHLLASTVQEMRHAIADRCDVEPSAILISCTHTHSAPHTTSLMSEDPAPEYLDLVTQRVVEAVRSACDALTPAVACAGSVRAPGLTFNRRTMYRNQEVGTHGPHWVPEFTGVEGPADEQLQVLWFEAPDGKILGGLVNFACHPTLVGKMPAYSADYPGVLVGELERQHGGMFAFLQGASGDLCGWDMASPETAALSPERVEQTGLALAAHAARLMDSVAHNIAGELQVASRTIPIPQRSASRREVELARAYLERGEGAEDQLAFTRAIYGHDYTFFNNSADAQEWFCREAIGMWEWQRRAGVHLLAEEAEIQAITVGGVAIVAYPCELFTEFGLAVKHTSPFSLTMVCELANGWHGYVPTRKAFDHGGYEPRLGYQSRLDPAAGTVMNELAGELLRQLEPGNTNALSARR